MMRRLEQPGELRIQVPWKGVRPPLIEAHPFTQGCRVASFSFFGITAVTWDLLLAFGMLEWTNCHSILEVLAAPSQVTDRHYICIGLLCTERVELNSTGSSAL